MPLLNMVLVPTRFDLPLFLGTAGFTKHSSLDVIHSPAWVWSLCEPAVKTTIVVPSPGLCLELIISPRKFHCSRGMFSGNFTILYRLFLTGTDTLQAYCYAGHDLKRREFVNVYGMLLESVSPIIINLVISGHNLHA